MPPLNNNSNTSMTLRLLLTVAILTGSSSLSLSSFSQFHGKHLASHLPPKLQQQHASTTGAASLTMRKQKASDRRTRRMQMGGDQIVQELIRDNLRQTVTSSPMQQTGEWKQKKRQVKYKENTGGRGRSRKRQTLYNGLSSYHNKFLKMLTDEYNHEASRHD